MNQTEIVSIVQSVLERNGYVVLGSHTRRTIGEVFREVEVDVEDRAVIMSFVIIGEATEHEATHQIDGLGDFYLEPYDYYYKVIAE